MRIALVADLHGNLPAVEALDKDLKRRGLERVYCLGDLVGKGPSSAETFDWAAAHCEVILAGNWDLGVLRDGGIDPHWVPWYRDQLGPARVKRLEELPLECELTLSGRRVRLFHGRPLMPELLFADSERTALKALFHANDETYQAVGYADCHTQFHRAFSDGYLFNCGSVGNSIGVPNVHYAILEGEESADAPFDLTLVSLPYDRERAALDALAAPGLPNAEAYMREVRTGVYSR